MISTIRSLVILMAILFFNISYAGNYNVLNNQDNTPMEMIVIYLHQNPDKTPNESHYYKAVVVKNNETNSIELVVYDYIKKGFKGDYEVFIRALKNPKFKKGDSFKVTFTDRERGEIVTSGTSEDGYLLFCITTEQPPLVSNGQKLMVQAPLGELNNKAFHKVKQKGKEMKIDLFNLIGGTVDNS